MNVGSREAALIAMSAVFFYFFGLVLPNAIPLWREEAPAYTGIGTPLGTLAPAFLALISLAGCTVFLRENRAACRHWYLGLPLWAVMAVATASLFLSPFIPIAGGTSPYNDPGYITQFASMTALFLLAPCTALFFWSRGNTPDKVTFPIVIALGISIISAILIYSLLFPQIPVPGEPVAMSVYEPIFWLYVILGMPTVGALYIALGIRSLPTEQGNDTEGNNSRWG